MDTLQKQVLHLTDKVDSLYGLIQQLNDKVTRTEDVSSYESDPGLQTDIRAPSLTVRQSASRVLEHKDILLDDALAEINKANTCPTLSPEIQIQRLTAQLTAAYNRIAALEEQLLTHRSH